jgi:hypothetical protein
MNGFNAEFAGTNNFFDAAAETFVVSGVSAVTFNQLAKSLDDTTSEQRAARPFVGAARDGIVKT